MRSLKGGEATEAQAGGEPIKLSSFGSAARCRFLLTAYQHPTRATPSNTRRPWPASRYSACTGPVSVTVQNPIDGDRASRCSTLSIIIDFVEVGIPGVGQP